MIDRKTNTPLRVSVPAASPQWSRSMIDRKTAREI